MVDTADSKSAVRKDLLVRVRPPVPFKIFHAVAEIEKPLTLQGLFSLMDFYYSIQFFTKLKFASER